LGFLKDFFQIKNESVGFTLSDPMAAQFLAGLGIDTTNVSSQTELNEVTYFTCMSHLCKTTSKMPWEKLQKTEKKGKEKLFDSEIDYLLNLRPNPHYTAADFWSCMEFHKNHYGNAYSYIEVLNGRITGLWILPANEMQIWRDDKGIFGDKNSIWYVWSDSQTGKQYKFFSDEILHFKSAFSFQGIVGISIKDMLKSTIKSQLSAEQFLQKLYSNNMFGGKVILNYTGDLDSTKEAKLAAKIESYSSTVGTGKFIPLPLGITAQTLDMKLSDAQFFDNNKMSALQIAAAFGIKPNVINNYDKSSYSNSETQQLDFYVNTLQSSFNNYNQEVTYKLLILQDIKKGIRLEINKKVLFEMDSKTRAEVNAKNINNFVTTPNEARESEDLPYMDEADVLIGNGNFIKLNQVGTQWAKGGSK